MTEPTHGVIPNADTNPAPQMLMHPMVVEMLRLNPTPETLREILTLQRDWQRDCARIAYVNALVDLRRDLPAWIKRDRIVDFAPKSGGHVHYTHASLAAAMEAVLPALTTHGFNLSWTPATSEKGVSITATLTHRGGHSESATISAPPDTSGFKSAAQAIASTSTLLERYTALALLGIATADMDEPRGGDGESAAPDHVDTARNMRAMADIAKTGKSRDDVEKFVGRPIQEWTGGDLERLRAWIAPAKLAEPPKVDAGPTPKSEADAARLIDAGELKKLKDWMKRFEIGAQEIAGIIESATGRRPASAKDVTAKQFILLGRQFARLERGEIDLNKKEMRFVEPPPAPSAAESGKSAEQLEADARQENIPF